MLRVRACVCEGERRVLFLVTGVGVRGGGSWVYGREFVGIVGVKR